MTLVLQAETASLIREAADVVGFGVLSLLVAALVALAYRWYVREPIPRGLATLFGVAAVAFYLQTVGLFADVVGVTPTTDPFATWTVLTNVLSLLVAAAAAPVGRRLGDRFTTSVVAVAGVDHVQGEVGRLARVVGRITPVELPGTIGDIEGYDPVAPGTKERLAGETLVLPGRLAGEPLREELVTRLKSDYGVSHVDVEFDDDESVSSLSVGARVAGLGPTLGPGTCAVAIRADPPGGASPGDVVQVWTTDPEPTRVASAEVRATAGDVVTVAVDESDATALSADREYRLLTLPAETRVDREFASLLRGADETMGVVAIGEDGDLADARVGDLGVAVVAVRPVDGPVEPLPRRSRALAPGETLYVVARPEAIRELEARAGGGDPSSTGSPPDGVPGTQPS